MQQLILGTGTAIWWLTEPHSSLCWHWTKKAKSREGQELFYNVFKYFGSEKTIVEQ
jgi:hypothetical protein